MPQTRKSRSAHLAGTGLPLPRHLDAQRLEQARGAAVGCCGHNHCFTTELKKACHGVDGRVQAPDLRAVCAWAACSPTRAALHSRSMRSHPISSFTPAHQMAGGERGVRMPEHATAMAAGEQQVPAAAAPAAPRPCAAVPPAVGKKPDAAWPRVAPREGDLGRNSLQHATCAPAKRAAL